MKKNKTICAFLFLIIMQSYGQKKYLSHIVKPNETVEDISRSYGVEKESLLNLNPDIRIAGLKTGFTIIIPMVDNIIDKNKNKVKLVQHLTREKETLYGLAKLYGTTVEEIVGYNPFLKTTVLKSNDMILVPKVISKIEGDNHIVSKKETLWSISQKYDVDINIILENNIIENNNLNIGDTLFIPSQKLDSYKAFYNNDSLVHYAKEFETLNSISKSYNLNYFDLLVYNPHIKEGLIVGDTIYLPTNIKHYTLYAVQNGETLYAISKRYDLPLDIIYNYNPILKEKGLMKGMTLRFPEITTIINEEIIAPKVSFLDSITNYNNTPINVALVLPLRLNDINFFNKEILKEKLENDKLLNYSLDFYFGAFLAIDSLTSHQLKINLTVFDSEDNKIKIQQLISKNKFENQDVVIGPFYPGTFNILSRHLESKNIPIVAPLSKKDIINRSNTVLSLPSDEFLDNKIINYIKKRSYNKNFIFISDEKQKARKERIINEFPYVKSLEITNKINAFGIDTISTFFSKVLENYVILETDKLSTATNITSVLNSLVSDTCSITLATTKRSKVFDMPNISNYYLSNLKFHYPSVRKPSSLINSFSKKYFEKYNNYPSRYSIRGFDIIFDIILRMAYNPKYFQKDNPSGESSYLENKFNYTKTSKGYKNESAFILKYENLELIEVK